MFDNYLFGLGQGIAAGLAVCVLIGCLIRTGRRESPYPLLLGAGVAVLGSLGAGFALEFGTRSPGLTFEAAEVLGGLLAIAAAGAAARLVLRMTHGELGAARRGLFAAGLLLVGREGVESARFAWSAVRSAIDPDGSAAPLALLLLGAVTAVGLCLPALRAVRRLPAARCLPWTAGLLAMAAAGMLGSGVRRLQEARLLPGASDKAYDLGSALPPDSWYGTLLTAVVGVPADPTFVQFSVWALCLVPALVLPGAPVGFGRSAGGEEKTTDEKADSGEKAARARPAGPDPDAVGRPGGAGADTGADGDRLCDGPRGAGRGAGRDGG
ncbi:FTR1 family protein [Streptomyces amakusaensis]|uniref:FTR1 family protein n=1 Tax=Streptomyces amakusaensis TaxID=67271 RepID=A0ABW0AKM9_9ACTN